MRKYLLALVLSLLILFQTALASANAYSMTTRDVGPCRKLKGNVAVVTIFVDTPRSSWTEAERDRFYVGLWKNTAEIEQQAASYGTGLSFSALWAQVSTKYNVSRIEDKDFNIDWYWDILKYYGLNSMQEMHDAWLGTYDDLAVLFLFDEEGRCYSYESESDQAWREEFPVYFTRSFPDGKIDHELYHLFGAIDLYQPAAVEKAARKYFGESLMMGGSINIDSFNAYLLGWTDALDDKAKAFREAVRGVN